MIGIRAGLAGGVRPALAVGPTADPVEQPSSGGLASVTRDASSSIYCPSSAAEWAAVVAAAGLPGVPLSTWLMQEPSGNLADSLDSNTLTVAGASWAYRQAVSGWSRSAIAVPDATANHNIQNSTTVPDIATRSVLLLAYVLMPSAAPTATRRIMRLDATTGALAQVNATPVIQCVTAGTGGSTVSGTASPLGAVRMIALQVNRAANTAGVFTDQERINGTQGTYAGLMLGFGSSNATTPAMGLLYAAMFADAAAELSTPQVKTLAQTLGWTIPWS